VWVTVPSFSEKLSPYPHHLNFQKALPEFIHFYLSDFVSEKKMGLIILVALAAHNTLNLV
jgi:hypothetical protein